MPGSIGLGGWARRLIGSFSHWHMLWRPTSQPFTVTPQFSTFSLLAADNGALAVDVEGDIDHSLETVDLVVPFGTAVDTLVPSWSVIDGLIVTHGGVLRTSGQDAYDFTGALGFTVIEEASEGTHFKEYTVTVTVAPE